MWVVILRTLNRSALSPPPEVTVFGNAVSSGASTRPTFPWAISEAIQDCIRITTREGILQRRGNGVCLSFLCLFFFLLSFCRFGNLEWFLFPILMVHIRNLFGVGKGFGFVVFLGL